MVTHTFRTGFKKPGEFGQTIFLPRACIEKTGWFTRLVAPVHAAWPDMDKASSQFIEARITEVLYTVNGKRDLWLVHSGSLVPIIIFSVGVACQTNTHAPCILVLVKRWAIARTLDTN